MVCLTSELVNGKFYLRYYEFCFILLLFFLNI